jgi:hypothetical protein
MEIRFEAESRAVERRPPAAMIGLLLLWHRLPDAPFVPDFGRGLGAFSPRL